MPAIPQPLIPALLQKLWLKLDQQKWTTRRDATAMLFGLMSLRIHEVTNVLTSQINQQEQTVFVRTLKGGRSRTLPIDDRTWQSVLRLIRHADDRGTSWLFHTKSGRPLDTRNLRRAWHKWVVDLAQSHFRFHDLRHTCARSIYERSGHDPFAVKEALGHKRIETTFGYLSSGAFQGTFLPTIGLCPDQLLDDKRELPTTQKEEQGESTL